MSFVRIDYNRLCADYEAGLVDQLRGFGVDEGAKGGSLALWVPDADLARSVRNLVEAVMLDGAVGVEIAFGSGSATADSVNALLAAVGHMGKASVGSQDGVPVLRVAGLSEHNTDAVAVDLAARASRLAEQAARERQRATAAVADREAPDLEAPDRQLADPVTEVAPMYRAAIDATDLTPPVHEDAAGRPCEAREVKAEIAGVELTLAVDPESHWILRARFAAPRSAVERALLERFCALIEGLPLLEASDHGAIRLEYTLRGAGAPRPVAGIVTPFSTDRAFALPNALIRRALERYREACAYRDTRNAYDLEPAAVWLSLDDAQRRQQLSSLFDAVAGKLGLPAGGVVVQDIDYEVRVTVEFQGDLRGADKQHILMALERAMKDSIDQRLELFQGELKDSNTIRRLS